ncbi:tetratricopeptide repeat protein [Nocardia sp. NPDC058497]|uniref:tetratricopeptide repeat protein n=1 Tax=Nocardia sp. NPDC058497 TaxID=3346529 RepID=UPI0036605172
MPVQAAIERARVAKEIGKVEEARRILGTALAMAPDDPEVLVALGNIALDLDDPAEALRWAGQAIHADPDSPDAHLVVGMAAVQLGDVDQAMRHLETAVRLSPHDAPTLLLMAWLLAYGPEPDETRARAALAEAVALMPDDADVHCSAAEIYQHLTDLDAVRRHVTAGLALDPTHTDLLHRQARLEFGGVDGGRAAAVSILRGLLARTPTDTKARRLLAEVHWRALMRLAAWVWAFAACLAFAAMWIPAGGLRVLSPVLFVALPLAWYGVFRKLRKQLPVGYLRARVMRPRPLVALLSVGGAGLIADLGAIAMRSQYIELVRLGGWCVVLGAFGAAFGHLLLFTAWQRRGRDDPYPGDAFDFAFGMLIGSALLGVPLLVIAVLGRGWARQPVLLGVLLAVLGIVLATVVLEGVIAMWRERESYRRVPAIVTCVLGLLLAAGAAVWWGGGEIVEGQVRGRELVDVPAPPTSRRPLPTIPSRLSPTPPKRSSTTVAPPTSDR